MFIVQSYSDSLDEYLKGEAMKDVLLSIISTTLSVRDAITIN
jgi:hypothetical protein